MRLLSSMALLSLMLKLPMANLSKAKGTRAETKVVNYLNDHGLQARRKSLKGSKDEGDIEVIAEGFEPVTLEIKAGKMTSNPSRSQLNEWLKQAEVEAKNSGTKCYLVVVRYKRKIEDAEVYRSYKLYESISMMHLDTFADTMKKFGSF